MPGKKNAMKSIEKASGCRIDKHHLTRRVSEW
jgi:hypothetical protein